MTDQKPTGVFVRLRESRGNRCGDNAMRTREEQIDSLYHGHNRYSTITQDAFRSHLVEAERRAEQRARAEIGGDRIPLPTYEAFCNSAKGL
ncbi:hypothetical protein, partial [Acetobacter lambici]